MLFLILFSVISYKAYEGTISYKECQGVNFDMNSCSSAKNLYEGGKALCKIQGKGFSGNSNCNG